MTVDYASANGLFFELLLFAPQNLAMLTHGWPSSFADFRRIIPMLTEPASFGGDPRDVFTVVAPSMLGHGFSFKPN